MEECWPAGEASCTEMSSDGGEDVEGDGDGEAEVEAEAEVAAQCEGGGVDGDVDEEVVVLSAVRVLPAPLALPASWP